MSELNAPADPVEVDRLIDAQMPETLAQLGQLVRQPSIAAQNLGVRECAALLAEMFREAGMTPEIIETADLDTGGVQGGGAPVVVATALGRRRDRTMLFYNHYDVQPPEPLELWDSPPFEPTVRDGRLFGRGVMDDKGHIICRLAALRALRDAAPDGQFPCNVTFVVEGEEEVGSPHLTAFVERYRDKLKADACLWEFGGVDFHDRAEIPLGLRGIMYVQLDVRTASADAHSGLAGSIFPNAAWRLVWALGSLKGPDGRVRIPGFYDDVVPATDRDRALLNALPDPEGDLKAAYGLRGFLNDATGLELKRQAVFEPTCTICGLGSGYQLAGSKTVLPASAMAKVDFRLVPNQQPADIVAKLRRHLVEQGFADIEVTQLAGEEPARVDPDHPFIRLCIDTAAEVYGRDPVVMPLNGGSGPLHPFVHTLGVPVGSAGIGYPGALLHAPNEHIRLSDFTLGVRHTARILDGFGRL